MQISLASDFDRFSQKIKSHINIDIKKKTDEALAYALEKKHKTSQEVDLYLQNEQHAWEKEYQEQEKQAYRQIKNDMSKQWSDFKKEREKVLRVQIQEKIEEIFPSLAESFISWVCKNYTQGTFHLPKAYISLINTDQFHLSENNQDGIIFKDKNLYIEYSIERIMDELNEEISSAINFKGNEWQV
ncbi:MAG: hypothetical protein COA44_05380 [Arcobacter sp.]|nr:MAG: hypothetical protein COA44_05380 [Arcobacter sp.]